MRIRRGWKNRLFLNLGKFKLTQILFHSSHTTLYRRQGVELRQRQEEAQWSWAGPSSGLKRKNGGIKYSLWHLQARLVSIYISDLLYQILRRGYGSLASSAKCPLLLSSRVARYTEVAMQLWPSWELLDKLRSKWVATAQLTPAGRLSGTRAADQTVVRKRIRFWGAVQGNN